MTARTSGTLPARLAAPALLALGAILLAPHTGPLQPADSAAATLSDHMDEVNKAMNSLKAQVADKSRNDSSLALVQTIEQNLLAAKAMEPPKARDLPAPQRPAYSRAFRAQVLKALSASLKLEQQLLDDDNDKAAATIAEILKLKAEGHKRYKPEDK